MELNIKYRPKTLDAIVGQPAAVSQIKGILKRGKLPSTVHINGPSGFGKTTMGRIMACMYEGLDNAKELPMDIKEINVGNKNGIADIRKLAEECLFKPTQYPYRIFLLDEVHALTQSSSNAILKVLEEPPSTTKFFLFTNQPQKVLPTIRRRGVTINLQMPTEDDIKKLIIKVCKGEKKRPDNKILKLIVKECRLSPAMALNLLDAVFSCMDGGGSLKDQAAMVATVTDTDIETVVLAFIHGCYTKKISRAMSLLYENRMDIVEFCTKAMDVHARMYYLLETNEEPDTTAMAKLMSAVNKAEGIHQTKMWLHYALADLRMKALNSQVIPDNHDLLSILIKQGS